MLSIGAFNALLKTLEEPPEHVLFILATTELHKVPGDHSFALSALRLPPHRRGGHRAASARRRGRRRHRADRGGGAADRRLADGAMRDALSMLDRAAAAGAVDEQTVTAALGVMGQDDGIHLASTSRQATRGGGDAAGGILQRRPRPCGSI